MSGLVGCKTCKKEIAKSAKTCPHCGVDMPGMNVGKGCLGIIVFGMLIGLIGMLAGKEAVVKQPDFSQHKPYELIGESTSSFNNRDRLEFHIYAPEALTNEQRAHTAIAAALYYQEQTKAHVIYIRLFHSKEIINSDTLLALADYAPDGGGNSGDQGWTWQVKASSHHISPIEFEIVRLWNANQSVFIGKNGLTNEDKLMAFIAYKLDISVEQVKFPFLNMKTYEPVFN